MILKVEKELFQWDKNRYVYVHQKDLDSDKVCIQFFNDKSRYGIESPLVDGRTKIPNFLLKENLPITALSCVVKDGETQVITRKIFKVLSRPRPEHYVDDDIDIEIIYDGGEEV